MSNTHLWEIYETSFLDSHVRNLDISGCLELKKAYIKGNQSTVIPLQKLNASNCSSLQYLNCQNSLLSDLSVSGCNNLLEFDVKNTMMKENVDEFWRKIIFFQLLMTAVMDMNTLDWKISNLSGMFLKQ